MGFGRQIYRILIQCITSRDEILHSAFSEGDGDGLALVDVIWIVDRRPIRVRDVIHGAR